MVGMGAIRTVSMILSSEHNNSQYYVGLMATDIIAYMILSCEHNSLHYHVYLALLSLELHT